MKKLYRSTRDKKFCGVCGGVAEYLGVDSTLVRLAFILLSSVFGSGLMMYILAAIIMPEKPEEPFRSFYEEQMQENVTVYDSKEMYK